MKAVIFAILTISLGSTPLYAQQTARVICEGEDAMLSVLGMSNLEKKVAALNAKIAKDKSIKSVSAPSVSISNSNINTLAICVTVY